MKYLLFLLIISHNINALDPCFPLNQINNFPTKEYFKTNLKYINDSTLQTDYKSFIYQEICHVKPVHFEVHLFTNDVKNNDNLYDLGKEIIPFSDTNDNIKFNVPILRETFNNYVVKVRAKYNFSDLSHIIRGFENQTQKDFQKNNPNWPEEYFSEFSEIYFGLEDTIEILNIDSNSNRKYCSNNDINKLDLDGNFGLNLNYNRDNDTISVEFSSHKLNECELLPNGVETIVYKIVNGDTVKDYHFNIFGKFESNVYNIDIFAESEKTQYLIKSRSIYYFTDYMRFKMANKFNGDLDFLSSGRRTHKPSRNGEWLSEWTYLQIDRSPKTTNIKRIKNKIENLNKIKYDILGRLK